MQIIPVIDLMGGIVVHARKGNRDQYRPLESSLCRGSGPLEVVDALLQLDEFAALYIADLDAIRRTGDNAAAIAAIATEYPALELWVDRGEGQASGLLRQAELGPCIPVLGTESLGLCEDPLPVLSVRPLILSLDYGRDGSMGPRRLHEEAALWPERVIVMTLQRVGSGEGPDLERLRAVRRLAGERLIYAAGGVRSCLDLEALAEEGMAGALIATALHDGRVTSDDIKALRSGRRPEGSPP